MSEFRNKITKEIKQEKPIIFIYSKDMYMSRFVNEFKQALKEYEGMFEVYFTNDKKEASKYFYLGEFPEVIPFVTIIEPNDRKQVKLHITEVEKQKGKEAHPEPISFENSYPKKYRELILANDIEKNMKKLLENYLDEKTTHFYTSKKQAHKTFVKTICTENFEKEVMQDPSIRECVIEVFKKDCPSCAFNGKVFNAFS